MSASQKAARKLVRGDRLGSQRLRRWRGCLPSPFAWDDRRHRAYRLSSLCRISSMAHNDGLYPCRFLRALFHCSIAHFSWSERINAPLTTLGGLSI
jgi:hypothetical protein